LPQTDASDDWWKAIANTFSAKDGTILPSKEPPRPKSLRLYNFGSPRVGNKAFAQHFDKIMQTGNIDQAYRLVNKDDVVARVPRKMITLQVDYDHCGQTVLVEEPTEDNADKTLFWIEKESDDSMCPVRDYENRVANPTSEGTLLGDLLSLTKGGDSNTQDVGEPVNQLGNLASKFQERLSKVTASDVASVIGIDKNFSEREIKIVQSLVKGDGLANHMEDSYYAAMGRAVGFKAQVGEDIVQAN
jgi:hypothetical protein